MSSLSGMIETAHAPQLVLTQDLRDFTVQIHHAEESRIVGTGLIVSSVGDVVTCAHVLREAGIDPAAGPAGRVPIYLPKRPGRRASTHDARVRAYFEGVEDDIVLLRVEGRLSLPAEQVAVLGPADTSRHHPFESYGYRRLEKYISGRAGGIIMGDVEPPEGHRVLRDPVQLNSSQINAGMSGAAVLDLSTNLVIGIVSETWFSGTSQKDRDTAWAVNASVLGLPPLHLPLQATALPLQSVRRPGVEPVVFEDAVAQPSSVAVFHGAPEAESDWVGREGHIDELVEQWHGGKRLVVGLVGFGGEGKSTLARRWLDRVVADPLVQPDGIFWWSFTAQPSVDEFFDAALRFAAGASIDPGQYSATAAKAHLLAGLLGAKRFLFVLDGLELFQYHHGDQYGSYRNADLRAFLQYFATPPHSSFCVLTSRVAQLDLAAFVTYSEFAVGPLTLAEGRALITKLGVMGPDASIEQLVVAWGGHALTLELIAAYLVGRHSGDVRQMATLPPPEPGSSPHRRLRQILDYYTGELDPQERAFVGFLSLLRRGIGRDRLPTLLAALPDRVGLEGLTTSPQILDTFLTGLLADRLLRSSPVDNVLSAHPLIRDYYARDAQQVDLGLVRVLHERISEFFLGGSDDLDAASGPEDLSATLEAVHHSAAAGNLQEAVDLFYDRLYRGARGLLIREFGAYESALDLALDFFPHRDWLHEPLVDTSEDKRWLLNETGTCLQMLGRLREGASVMLRAARAAEENQDWHNAGVSRQNLGELYLQLGALAECNEMAHEVLRLGAAAGDREDELVAYTLLGEVAHLYNKPARAGELFAAALEIATTATQIPYLYSRSGYYYSEHLRYAGRREEAVQVTEANLAVSRHAGWIGDIAECQLQLGLLSQDRGDLAGAERHYEEALRTAGTIPRRDTYIRSLWARGQFSAETGDTDSALQDLEEALGLATMGEYLLLEADVRSVLARVSRAMADEFGADMQVERAHAICAETGYALLSRQLP